jgi:glucose/arabinose dehydrogenase
MTCALRALAIAMLAATAAAAQPVLVPVVGGLASPVFVTTAGDGSHRLFIVERGGAIKVLAPGSAAPTVFLDIADRVLSGGEQGLLGLAFHPRFASNQGFFVNYTRRPDGATVIAE